jgi:diguanylate cyclase (GGDEF)-like protein/PAS domain S-box-containing protein
MSPDALSSASRTSDEERRLRLIIEATPNAMLMVDVDGRMVLVNSQTEQLFGYPRDQLLAMRVDQLIPERFRRGHRTAREEFFRRPDTRAMGAGRELFGLRADGSEVPIEIGLNPLETDEGTFVLASIIDITERTVAQTLASASREDAMRRSILDSIPFSIVATDLGGRIVTANPAAARLLGYGQDELIGSALRHIRGTAPDRDEEWSNGSEREWVYVRKDGTRVPVNEAVAPMRSDDGTPNGFLTVAYDITKRIKAQAEVRHLASHDVLTDLPNRTLLHQHLADAIGQADRDRHEIVVLILDLDHFKRVNDSLGHQMGDELLLAMADRLRRWVDDDDMVARLGGDEFVIVFRGVPDGTSLTPRIEDLMRALLAPVDVHGHEVLVTVSMGAVRYPEDGTDPATLLKNADTAMYQAKSAGRNNFQWFCDAMLDETNDKITLAAALRQAIERDEISVVYQPQVDLGTGEVVSMEALARWESPELGQVGPDRFIPVAEDSGMIGRLGQSVLRHACQDARAIQAELGRPLRLSVNVSPRQFHSTEWWTVVNRVLHDTGFDPGALDLEITEGILMEDPHDVVDLLHAFRLLGIRIVVDDFGTGFSSLAYLTRFPIDKIKIDRSFVRAMNYDDADAAIVDTIIVMAHTLGMTVVAEGVETGEQERYLQRRACDEAQGFLYGAGIPAEKFAQVAKTIESA